MGSGENRNQQPGHRGLGKGSARACSTTCQALRLQSNSVSTRTPQLHLFKGIAHPWRRHGGGAAEPLQGSVRGSRSRRALISVAEKKLTNYVSPFDDISHPTPRAERRGPKGPFVWFKGRQQGTVNLNMEFRMMRWGRGGEGW